MVAGSAPVRNGKDVDGVLGFKASAYFAVVAIISEELSAENVAIIDGAIRTEMGDMSLFEKQTNKGIANGYAGLNSSGLVPTINLPPNASTNYPFFEQIIKETE